MRRVYELLLRAQGPSGWWPAETPFEVCVGAILVQNTNWIGAERALAALRERGLLEARALSELDERELCELLRPAGTYRVKARRLKAFLDFLLAEFGGDVAAMGRVAALDLRARLLRVHGIGPETADCIVLYAAGLPVFVVDAYTRRVGARLGLTPAGASYDALQRFFTERLPSDVALYGEYHAQVVRLAKDTCRTRPRCAACALARLCPRVGVP